MATDLTASARMALVRVQQAWTDGRLAWGVLGASITLSLALLAGAVPLVRANEAALAKATAEVHRMSWVLLTQSPRILPPPDSAGPIPTVKSPAESQALILDAAVGAGCRVDRLAVRDEAPLGAGVRQARIDFRLSGNYAQTKAALGHLLANEPSLVVDQLTWSTGAAGVPEMAASVVVPVADVVVGGVTDAK